MRFQVGPWRPLALLAVCVLCTLVLGGAPAQAQEPLDKKVSLNLRDTPLRDAVSLVFAGSGLQYSIDPNVPNVPVNLAIRDVSLQSALRMIVRQAAVASPGLTFSRDGDIFVVKIRAAAPPPTEATDAPPEMAAEPSELTWEKIPIQFNDVMVFTLAFGGTMLPTEADIRMAQTGGMMGMMGGMGGYGGMGGMGGYGGGMGGYGGGMGGFGGGMGGYGGGLGGYGGGMGGYGGGMGGYGGSLGGYGGTMGGYGGGNYGGGVYGRRF